MTCEFSEKKLVESQQLIADFTNDAIQRGLIEVMSIPGFAVPTLIVGAAGAPIVVTGENDTLVSTANQAEYTFSNVSDLGTHTEVFLLVTLRGAAAGQTVTGLTVEGVAAAKKAELSNGSQRAEIWAISSSVATPDIAITLSGTAANIKCYAVGTTGASLTAVATQTSNADPAALNVNTQAKGLVLACGVSTGATSMTWTGVDEKYDTAPETQTHTGGYFATTIAETPRTVSGNWAGSSTWAAVSASFGPSIAPNPGPSRILDGYSNVTGAWSMSRTMLTSYAGGALYTTDTGVDQLNDQTGNARHFTQAIGGNQPTVAHAGPSNKKALGLVSAFLGEYLTGADTDDLITNSAGYIVVCCLPTLITVPATIDDGHRVFSNTDASPPTVLFELRDDSGDKGWAAFNDDGSSDFTWTEDNDILNNVIVCEWMHESGNIKGRVNGGTWTSVSSGNTADLARPLVLGSPDVPFKGYIFEAVTFNAIPTEGERNALVGNMMSAFGAT